MVNKKSTSAGEIYIANRCKGWSQAKSMERVIMFTKRDRTTRERVIRNMLTAEKRFSKRKCPKK